MKKNHIDPTESTILKRAILFPVFFLSAFLLVFSFSPTGAWAVPNPPSNLTAKVVSSSQIDLSWTDNSPNETGFSIERKTGASGTYTVIGSVGPNVTTYSTKNLIQTTTYYYRVRAKSGSTYSTYSNEVGATALPMNPPSNLITTMVSSSQVDLSWTDNSTDETGFSIERKTGAPGTYAVIGNVGPNVTTYSSKTLIQTTTYYYRVRAKSGSTYSTYSNEIGATALPMNPPSGLTAAVVSSSEIDLSWTDSSTDETGFSIERKTGTSGTYAVIGNVGPNVTTYSSKTLIQTTTYYYRVRARSGSTYSAYSNEVSATALPMNPPSNLTATVISSSQIDIFWTDNSTDETGFSIERKTGALGTYTVIGSVGPNVTTYSSKNLIQTTTYYYRVRAKSGSTFSAYSNEVSASTSADITPPTGSVVINGGAAFTNSTTVTLTLSATDSGSGVASMQFSNNNTAWSTSETYTTSKSWTLTAGDGAKTVYAKFKDKAKNWSSAIPSNTITLDTTPPLVAITAPATGFTNNKTPLLNYTVSDGTVVVKVDGTVVPKVSGTNLDALSDGPHTIRVESTDAANNTGNAEVTFTVDTTPPVITITSPVAGPTNNNTPLLSYTVSDGAVVVKVDGTVVSKTSGNNLDALPDGRHTIRVESTDAANNIGFAEVNITIDTIAPIVTITSPATGITNNNKPLLTYTVSDGTIVVKIDGVVVSKTSGNNLNALLDGQHTIRVESTDAANNIGFAEVAFTITTADTTPPTTALSSTPSSPDGLSGWFKTIPTITLTSSESGTTYYQWGSYQWGSGEYYSSRQAQEWVSDGTPLNIRGDDTGAWYTLPFSFTFYGTSYSQVYLSSNGLLSFVAEDTEYDNTTGIGSRVAIAPLWDDLLTDTRPDDDIYVFRPDADSIGFRWKAVTINNEKDTNFEVILYRDGLIRFNYGAQDGDIDATIGISKGDGATYSIVYDDNIFNTNNMDSIVYSPVQNWQVYSNPFYTPEGQNTLYYFSVDIAGNVEAIRNQSFEVDAIAPVVTITSPQAGLTKNTMPVLSYALSKVTSTNIVMMDGAQVNILSGDKLGPLLEGPHTVRVDVTDQAGHTAFAEVTFTVVPFAQNVSIISPSTGTTNNNTPLLSYTVNYGAVVVKVDGDIVNKVSGETLDTLADGDHTVRVEARNADGVTVSAEVRLTVDTSAPLQSGFSKGVHITAGDTHALAISADGKVWEWGRYDLCEAADRDCGSENKNGTQFSSPTPQARGTIGHGWTTVAAGLASNLALTADGALWVWGQNEYGQLGTGTISDKKDPYQIVDDHDWKTISTSGLHSLAIKQDGTLWAWGFNAQGQLGDGTANDHYTPVRIGNDADWAAISAGGDHTVALKSDGTLWMWGEDQFAPARINNDTDWRAISAGKYHTMALKADGSLWAWGFNYYGQLGDGSGTSRFAPVRIGADADWIAVSAGDYHTLALKADGTLWAWGANSSGQLGDGSGTDQSVPVRIGAGKNWSSIAAGEGFSMALKADGSLWTWGNNSHGQLGDGTSQSQPTPHLIDYSQPSNVLIINGGAAVTDNPAVVLTLNAWDAMSEMVSMQFSNDGTTWSTPERYKTTKNWTMSARNGTITVYARFQDSAGNWSSAYSGSIQLNDTMPLVIAILSPAAGFTQNNQPLLGYSVNKADTIDTVKVDGLVVNTIQGGALDILSDGTHAVRVDVVDVNGFTGFAEVTFIVDSIPPTVAITSPAAGLTNNNTPIISFEVNKSGTVNVVKVDGTIVNKISGETLDRLADGIHKLRVEVTDAYGYKVFAETSFTVDTTPPSGTVMPKFVKIAAGGAHSLAIATNGTLWAWGQNLHGMLGDGTTYDRHAPVQIGTDANWRAVSAGDTHSVALKSDGSLWAWGLNNSGQLGDETNVEKHVPTRIGTDADWVAISAGGCHSAAIKTNGSVYTWGCNVSGQIGNGSHDNVSEPNEISTIYMPSVSSISLGAQHSIAISDGQIFTWGDDSCYQLARFSCVPYNEPGPIGFEPGSIEFGTWTTLAAGANYNIALKPDGTLWTWGCNSHCTLGNGCGSDSYKPLQIGTDTNWTAISAGGSVSVALKDDGTLWAWGTWSDFGPVGVPTQIGSDADWTAISAGDDYGLALKHDGTLLSWGYNANGRLGDGTTQSWSDAHPVVSRETHTPILINNGASSTGSASVTLTLFDWDGAGSVVSMQFSGDGTTWTGSEPYAATKNWILDQGNGPKTVYVKFQDAVGNWSSSYSASIVLVLGAPTVTITSPAAGPARNNAPLLTYTASEGTVVVKVNGNEVNKLSGDRLGPLDDGAYTVRVEATNGNGTGFAELTFTVDTVAPIVMITSPTPNPTNNTTPLLTYTASDGTVAVKVDKIAVNRRSGDALPALYEFSHIVRVEATDAAGNMGYAEVTFSIDTVPPTVTIYSPTAGVTNNKTPALSYYAFEGVPFVTVDNVIVNKLSGDTLDALTEGSHTVRVETMDAAGNKGFAEVIFTVDTIAPTVTITSPTSGTTNNNTPVLTYNVNDGTVVVRVDGNVVSKVSGDTLDALPNGDHILRVEATDAAGNKGFAEVTFSVDAATGKDDTNIYCMGTGTYLVGPSSFTSGISVPTMNNEVRIASPLTYSTINGPRTIVKGAMDTTIPVNSVMIVVSSGTGTAGYPAQVNGKYFAAQISVTADINTISAIATDQTGSQHPATVSVTVTTQPDNVTLQASPNTGIPTLKQSGKTLLDVALMTSASLTTAVASYDWDFSGTGASDLTCFSHSNVTASYEQVGLYLTTVTVTDTAGKTYTDTVIVNVVDANEASAPLIATWKRVKTALIAGEVETALNEIVDSEKDAYRTMFTQIGISNIKTLMATGADFELESYSGNTAECGVIRQESDGIYSYPIGFAKDANGVWKIRGF